MKFKTFQGLLGVKICVLLMCLSVWMVCSQHALADNPTYGPPIEIGCGGSGYRMQSRPDWGSKYCVAGFGTVAVRVFKGLSIQAGKEYGNGDNPRVDLVNYGENVILRANKRTTQQASWIGARYDVPASIFNSDFMGMDFICASAGMMFTKFGLKCNYQVVDGILNKLPNTEDFRIAKVSGPFVGLTARWRIDSDITRGTDAWFGAYGFDIGVRYTRYTDQTTKHDNITAPKSNFNCYQLFIVAFVKIKLLY